MSTFVSNRDSGGKTNEEGHYRFQTKVWSGNVLSGMTVEQNGSPNMTVRVAAGDIRIPYSNYAYTAWNDSYASVTITTADTSNPRIDRIIAYVDRTMSFTVSDTNNPDALKFIAIPGTPASVPIKAVDSVVDAATPSDSPWVELATVAVGANVTQITTGNITDTRQLVSLFNVSLAPVDWASTLASVSSSTYNGNGSYSLSVSNDLRSVINPGTRIRTTRTVAAPTQSTLLNGTTQYFVKTSPNKQTFTDDFTVMFDVYPTSLTTGVVVSRFNGTSGWYVRFNSNGTIEITGLNGGGGNYRGIVTYQALPLNKWTNVVMQLDMSANTATSTTSYIMFDGVDVPALVYRGGTDPSSLVQAGNYEIGATNGGSVPFVGGIANVGLFSAKVTQATARGYISQGLTGSETNLSTAHSLSNSLNDLNTTTPNNLTAQGSATTTNANAPWGQQADGTISSTYDYGIVQKVTASTITVQVPSGNRIPTSGGISNFVYSSVKAPYGFPAQRHKWMLRTQVLQNLVTNVATNTIISFPGWKIEVPVGEWIINGSGTHFLAGGAAAMDTGISTSNSSITRFDWQWGRTGSLTNVTWSLPNREFSNPNSTTAIYGIIRQLSGGTRDLYLTGGEGLGEMVAENAYL